MMNNKKPFDPSLPGRLGKMTREQLDAESDQFDPEFVAMNSPTIPNVTPHPPKRRSSPENKKKKILPQMNADARR